MPRQANPRLQSPQLFKRSARSKTSEEFLKELEELAKLNRGGFSTFAEDTGAEPGFVVPGGMATRQGQFVPDTAGQTKQTQATPPQYPNIPPAQQDEMVDYEDSGDYQQPDLSSAEIFFDAVAQATYAPQIRTPSPANPDPYGNYPIQSREDGTILWSDGSIRGAESVAPPQPIASMEDGNVLWSDGYVRPPLPDYAVNQFSGVEGLSQGLFGRQQTVTQPYGNINPIEPTPGNVNLGSDFRTRDLQTRQITNFFNQPLEVVESYNQAQPGSGGVGNYENRGYGNSLLLRFPDGRMLRISHLDENPYEAGQVINPGEIIGVPGSTGNVTGEHADVEVYNAQGQIINPRDFISQVREGSQESREPIYRLNEEGQKVYPQSVEPGTQPQAVTGQTINQTEVSEQPSLIQKIKEAKDSGGSLVESIAQAPQAVAQAFAQIQQAVQPGSPQREQLASGVEDVAQRIGFDTDVGLSEGAGQGRGEEGQRSPAMQARVSALGRQAYNYNPYKQFLGNVSERIGDTLGVPEGAISESIAGGPTKRTGQALAAEMGQTTPQQVPGIRQNLQDIGQDLQSRAQNAYEGVTGGVKNAVADIKQFTQDFQPGAGLKKLKEGEDVGKAKINLFSKKEPQEMAPSRVVGASAGAGMNVNPSGKVGGVQTLAREGMDTSDPFFSSELFKKVSGYTSFPENYKIKNQALSEDIFENEFYEKPEQVSDVFSDTYMKGSALTKASDAVKNQYKESYSDKKYDQADVNRILSRVPQQLDYTPDLKQPSYNVQLIKDQYRRKYSNSDKYNQDDVNRILSRVPNRLYQTPNLPSPRKIMPTLSDYLRQGKTARQWYAETGQQSSLDRVEGNPRLKFDETSGNISLADALRPSRHNYSRHPFKKSRSDLSYASAENRRKPDWVGRHYEKIMNPLKYQPQDQTVQARMDIRDPHIRKTSSDFANLIIQGAGNPDPGSYKRKEDKGTFSRAKGFAKGIFNRFFN